MKKDKKLIFNIVIWVWAFISMLVMAQIYNYGITGIDIILPCLFALNVIIFSKTYRIVTDSVKESKKDLKYSVVIGSIADICTVIGNKIDLDTGIFAEVTLIDFVYILVLIPFFVCIIRLLLFFSDYAAERLSAKGIVSGSDRSDKKQIVKCLCIYASILFVCWLPYYLAYFPGGVNEDDFECINIIRGNIPWVNHHPALYTAIMKLFITVFGSFGDLTLAMGAMVFAQMIMMAFTLAAMLVWLKKHGAGKLWINISLAFMALHSAFPMFSVCLTKDVMFSCVTVIMVLFLYEFCDYFHKKNTDEKKNENKKCAILGVLSFLIIVTRNNGTFVMAVTLMALIIFLKQIRKKLLIVAIIVFALNGLYKGPVWQTLGIQKQSFVESASIPLTQIAYTIYSDGVTEGEDKEYLESIMPFEKVKKNYIPGAVDSYKFDKDFNTEIVDGDPAKVIKVWFRLLPDNFGDYVEAYLFQTCGYWHYGVTNTLCSEGVKPNDLGIESTDYVQKITGLPLNSLLSKLMLVVRKLPVLCAFTQMAIQLLAVVLTAVIYERRKESHLILALVPLLAIWCSIMIAVPSYCLFRYMLPVFFLWPVTLYCFFQKRN